MKQRAAPTLALSALVTLLYGAPIATAQPKAADPVTARFQQSDADGDRRLSLDEYLVSRGDPKVATRDFMLFDIDGNGFLSRDEFAAVPTVIDASRRGALPDPMLGVVDQAMAALDASLDNWNERPNDTIERNQFVSGFLSSLMLSVTGAEMQQADPDGDGRVTREEARRFLEIQHGVRRHDGQLLREANGRVVNYHLYLHIDQNRNDRLERAEYLERSYASDKAEAEFAAGDADRDGSISFEEYGRMPGRAFEDPIQQFRQYDTNFDGLLDRDELLAGSPEWKRKLAARVFPGFDLDTDGRLSLNEYRLTMQANMIGPWTSQLLDRDDDGRLSLQEFQWDRIDFPLLRMMFFHRLDRNQDQALDSNEFDFHVRVPDEFFVMNADGTGWRSLFLFAGHKACGSPAVSPDGQWLAFDAWASPRQQNAKIFVMPLSGGEPKSIRSGMMPAWSPDGKKLCYSWNNSVWITTADGRQLRIATQGWGGQWSPDGKKIAYSFGNAIKTYDVESEQIVTVLDAADNPYTTLYWNMAWSPDGTRLCFKGSKPDNTHEVASVSVVNPPDLKVHHSGTQNVNADFAWHPDGRRVMFSRYCRERSRMQLYEFDPKRNDLPQLMPGQDPDRNNTDMCWTPDGKQLIVVSGDF